ncbi:hypothetical protein HDV02_006441 [Globomyces sp. JEL0801]|nr:hypothetical protein HDV02_006441 [Globomyces sp. JEL0801]
MSTIAPESSQVENQIGSIDTMIQPILKDIGIETKSNRFVTFNEKIQLFPHLKITDFIVPNAPRATRLITSRGYEL